MRHLAALVLLIVVIACETDTGISPPPDFQPSTTRSVTYHVTGTAEAVSVTYSNAQGGTQQGQYRLPFRQRYTMEQGSFAYISAQNLGTSGTVECRITVDRETWRESVSSGAHVIASCDGMVP